jgi:hypothetical protein
MNAVSCSPESFREAHQIAVLLTEGVLRGGGTWEEQTCPGDRRHTHRSGYLWRVASRQEFWHGAPRGASAWSNGATVSVAAATRASPE